MKRLLTLLAILTLALVVQADRRRIITAVSRPSGGGGGGGGGGFPSSGLLGYWSLDSFDGSDDWADFTANHVLHTSGSAATGTGLISTCADTAGNHYLYNATGWNLSSGYTIHGWVNLPALSDNTLFGFSDFGGADIRLSSDGSITYAHYDGSWHTTTLGAGTMTTATWHRIAARYNGSQITLTVDTTSSTPASAGSLSAGGTPRFTVAAEYGGGFNSPLDGLYDEFGVWSRALNSTEMSTLYNSGAGLAP